MFDYAMFYRLVHSNLNAKSENILYICEDAKVRRIFARNNPDIERRYILTINDIWCDNKLRGLCYKDYKMIDKKRRL